MFEEGFEKTEVQQIGKEGIRKAQFFQLVKQARLYSDLFQAFERKSFLQPWVVSRGREGLNFYMVPREMIKL